MTQTTYKNVSAAKLAKLKKQAEKMHATKFEANDKGNGMFDVLVEFADAKP
jgi:hypothetical protein